MRTLQLKISDKVYYRFMWLLSKFNTEEIEIVSENGDFKTTSNYLQQELNEMESRKANFISQEEFKNKLNEIVSHSL